MAFPVMKAFGATFAYLQRHALDLFKALWLPTALLIALQFYAAAPFFSAMASFLALGPNPDQAEAAADLGAIAKWGGILTIGSAILVPMTTVASLRHIVRGEAQQGLFYLGYGGDELRILAGYALVALMIIMISIIGGLAIMVIAAVAAVVGLGAAAARSVGDVALNIVVAWFRLRLSVLFPASLATRTVGLGVSFEATKGEALRLFFFWVLIGAALLPIGLVTAAPFASDILPLMERVANAGSDEAAVREAMIPLLGKLATLFSIDGPQANIAAPLFFASTIATTAITNVAGGAAWRLLTDHAAPKASAAMAA